MQNILKAIFDHAKNHPLKVALQMKGEPGITFQELKSRIEHVKTLLLPYIQQPGYRFVILGNSCPEWIITFLGINLAGGTVVPIDPNLEEAHIEKLILRAEPHVVFISDEAAKKFSSKISSFCPTFLMGKDYSLLNGKTTISYTLEDYDSDVAALLFTSGTTGDYKGVLLSQKGFDAAKEAALDAVPLTIEDVIISVLPAHHIFGLVSVLLVPLAAGAKIVFLKKLQGAELLEALQTYQPTVMVAVPRVLQLLADKILAQAKERGKAVYSLFYALLRISSGVHSLNQDLNIGKALFGKVHKVFGGKLTRIVSGGAPLSEKLYHFFSSLGFTVIEGYGMTETTALISANRQKTRKAGTVGEIVRGMQLKLLDSNGKEGEVCVYGESVTLGYYRDPETTKKAFSEDWFRTGDLGYLDEKQRLVLTGRIKELIILPSGKNVSPEQVEQHYQGIPFIEEIAVFGMPFAAGSLEEEIHAAVVLQKENQTPSVDRESVIENEMAKRAKSLPSWWQIKKIHFVNELPKTTTLKVKRQLLKGIHNFKGSQSKDRK